MAFIPNFTPRVQAGDYKPWFTFRNMIFQQAIDDWESASQKSRDYVLNQFAKMTPADREAQFAIAEDLKLRWRECAATWLFFHSQFADDLLVDTDLTGAEVWRIYLDGSYNRGGIRDKKYHIAKLPTDAECKRPLPARFDDHSDLTFADRAFPARKARERRKKKGAKK